MGESSNHEKVSKDSGKDGKDAKPSRRKPSEPKKLETPKGDSTGSSSQKIQAASTGPEKGKPRTPPTDLLPLLPHSEEEEEADQGSPDFDIADAFLRPPARETYQSPLQWCYPPSMGPRPGVCAGACGVSSMASATVPHYWHDDDTPHDDGPPDHTDVPAAMDLADDEEVEEGEVMEDGAPDLLAGFRERYVDEDGPPLPEDMAKAVNAMWKKGKDAERAKELYRTYPRPSNLAAQKVDINTEIVAALPKHAKTKDISLRAVQTAIARATVPAVDIATRLRTPGHIDRQGQFDKALDSITLLGHANAMINQVRRDNLKYHIQPRFHALCKPGKEIDTTHYLFGENLADCIKTTSQGSRFGKLRGRGGTPQGRGRARWNPYTSNFTRGASRVRVFLGKPY